MAKEPLETVPGGAGHGAQVNVPEGGEEKAEDAVEKGDPAPPTVPGGKGDGPMF
jgi:hypothetical protein